MGLFRRIVDLATKTDPLASWGERVVYLVLFLFGPSTISALVLGGLSWLASNLVYGALVGLGAFALTQVGLTLLAVRRSATRTGPFAEPVSEDAATRTLSQADAEEVEQLRKKLTEAERELLEVGQEREQLRVDKGTLTEELQQVRADASEVGAPAAGQEEQPVQRKAQDEHEKRKMLKRALAIAHSKGIRLDNSSGSSVVLGTAQLNNQAFRKWENETYALIRAAFVENKHAESFFKGSDLLLPASIQPLLADRLWHLVWIILAADEAELRPDFDPQEWMNLE